MPCRLSSTGSPLGEPRTPADPVTYDPNMAEPVVLESVSIERLPLGANGSRRAIVKWSDGSVGEALR
jgi:hypothetical protein